MLFFLTGGFISGAFFFWVDPMLHQNDCHGISIRREEEEARDKRREMKDTEQEGEMERMVKRSSFRERERDFLKEEGGPRAIRVRDKRLRE